MADNHKLIEEEAPEEIFNDRQCFLPALVKSSERASFIV